MQAADKKPIGKKKAFLITGKKPIRRKYVKKEIDLNPLSEITQGKIEVKTIEYNKKIQELEQFAYSVSHDLQEPLRKILIFSELIEENEADSAARKFYLEKIKSSAKRMTKLIRDVLHYSKQSVELDLFEETDLNKIVRNILEDFEILISEKGALIKYKTLPVINGIPVQLYQLFLNLIGNSLKYCAKKPVIEITSKYLKAKEVKSIPQLSDESEYLQISVKDNGIGFEPHYAEKIFNAFHRLHDQTQYQGTGIGLALCKKIVDNHKGFITAVGKKGKGSIFIVYLPV